MIHVRRHFAAAGGTAFALHDEIVTFDLDGDAIGAQHIGGGGEPVGFFDAQFLKAAHARDAFGEGRGHRKDRIFVDHRRRPLRRHLDAFQAAGAHAQIGNFLAAVVARLEGLDAGAHLAQRRQQAGA